VIVKIDEKLGLNQGKVSHKRHPALATARRFTSQRTSRWQRSKFEQYHVDRSIYVVDLRQSLHLQQAFAILKLWGFPQAEKCYHLGYGFVSLPEGAMSARRGRVGCSRKCTTKRSNACWRSNPNEAAMSLKMSARRSPSRSVWARWSYSMLSVDNNKDIVFDMDEALSFDGRTGPYIQNAHVRASSILKKAGASKVEGATFDYELTKHEIELIEQISRFPNAVQQAANEYRPLVMAQYAYDLANAFHSFYHAVPVLQSEDENIRNARLGLVAAAKQTIVNALRLLDIQSPDVM
jgi:arginyl-tRNA synthetase